MEETAPKKQLLNEKPISENGSGTEDQSGGKKTLKPLLDLPPTKGEPINDRAGC